MTWNRIHFYPGSGSASKLNGFFALEETYIILYIDLVNERLILPAQQESQSLYWFKKLYHTSKNIRKSFKGLTSSIVFFNLYFIFTWQQILTIWKKMLLIIKSIFRRKGNESLSIYLPDFCKHEVNQLISLFTGDSIIFRFEYSNNLYNKWCI